MKFVYHKTDYSFPMFLIILMFCLIYKWNDISAK